MSKSSQTITPKVVNTGEMNMHRLPPGLNAKDQAVRDRGVIPTNDGCGTKEPVAKKKGR